MVGERAPAILNRLLYRLGSRKVVADVIGDKIILLYKRKMQEMTMVLHVTEDPEVLVLQSAKFLVYRTNATARLTYDSDMFELYYVCNKGTIYARRKHPDAEILITQVALIDMFATPKLLYDYMRAISGFDYILPKTILCRSFY